MVSPYVKIRTRSRGVAVAFTLTVFAVFLVACGGSGEIGSPPATVTDSGPSYRSVEDLTSASDLVVIGHPVGEIGREIDRGGDPEVDPESGEPIPGIPMVIAEVEIDKVLAAALVPAPVAGDTIAVAYPAADGLSLDDADVGRTVLLPEGRSFALFLEHLDGSTAPGITLVDDFYVPQGGLAGVFDIDGKVAVGLGAVDALRAGDRPLSAEQEMPVRLEVPLDELISVVRSSEAGQQGG